MKLSQLLFELQIPRIVEVYYPSDDSFLIIDYLDSPEFKENIVSLASSYKKIKILDMGCGTGVIGFCLLYKLIGWDFFDSIHLTFVDVNPKALEVTKFMLEENMYQLKTLTGFKHNLIEINYFTSDLLQNVPKQIYNIIVFNPPYLPQDDEIHRPHMIDHALYGGLEGITIISNFFQQISTYVDENSDIFFILSSLGNLEKFFHAIETEYQITLLQNIHQFFEDFGLFRAKKNSKITNIL